MRLELLLSDFCPVSEVTFHLLYCSFSKVNFLFFLQWFCCKGCTLNWSHHLLTDPVIFHLVNVMLSALHKPVKNSENDKLRSEYLFLSVLIYGFFISCLELFYPDNCLVFMDELNMIYKVFFIIHLSASAKVFVL